MTQTIRFGGEIHNFPDDFTDEDISAALSGAPAASATPEVGVGEDLAKTAIPSLGRMVSDTLGTPGDIGSLLSAGADKLYNLVSPPQRTTSDLITGAEPKGGIPQGLKTAIRTAASGFPIIGAMAAGPTSQQVQSIVSPVAGDYEPQTTGGKVFDTAVRFAPAAIGGPETLAAKIGTRVLAPAAASEAAGQLAEGTGAESYVKPAAAIAANLAAHRFTTPKPKAITTEDLRSVADDTYKQVHSLGLELKSAPVANLAAQIENKLTRDGLTTRNAKPVYEALETLKNPPPGGVVTSHNFDNLRKEMVQATQSIDGSVRRAAGQTIGELDNYLASLPASHVIKGNAQQASALFKEARGNWAALKRLEQAGGKIELGQLNAGTANSGQNLDNNIRQAIKQLIRPDKYGKSQAQKSGFSKEEIVQMNKIARGTSAGNLVRTLGNMAGGGLGIGVPITAGIAAYHLGPEGAAVPIAGYGLRKLGNALTARQAGRLERMVGQRSPLGATQPSPIASNPIPPALLAALLARPRGILPLDQGQ